MKLISGNVAASGASRAARKLVPVATVAAMLLTACDRTVTGPGSSAAAPNKISSAVVVNGLTIYTDRTEWETAVATLGTSATLFDFAGLTLGRVTQVDTDYGLFRLVADRVSTDPFKNSGLDLFQDANCSLGTGNCDVFTLNVFDPTTTSDGPRISQIVMDEPLAAFGGDFIQTGATAGSGLPTGPVTLQFGSETIVINPYLDALGNGFFGFIAQSPATTLTFTFVKSGTIQNDIFQIYNPAYAIALSTTPEEQIGDVRDAVAALALSKGSATAFDAKLRAALAALAANNTAAACSSLQDFIDHTNARAGKDITAAQAAALIASVTAIRQELGC
ncbi:MAG TPA: hypothetical protein VM939_06740 [Gemmatimonadaceae bacterium]|nr:hypothetical protein [Gemmatimonadaceae bacterium]